MILAFSIVKPAIVGRKLLKGDVVILHSPIDSINWYLYGEKFRLNEIIEGSYTINCRCAGARQFGGRILVIYRKLNGRVKHRRLSEKINFYKEVYHGRSRS